MSWTQQVHCIRCDNRSWAVVAGVWICQSCEEPIAVREIEKASIAKE